ncbi:hypothetical protein M409DRAFT_21431 [Zasmidium cellare ATCC 36951]|uniref:SnoaL-like domain-containing protein n=1 Tax=Zasmidium cellare ATCC 36951 TaxID=1080233 RepID=A0A6A6CRC8_ZASCE|nr:uncharacterized protein M409DRAFT_21431 [Zasmidium cellare ATCC 36951]KAF2168690.1 hypothetical protein M409DRAFT_21431 [Zasmidium cellare ATCC 36951]
MTEIGGEELDSTLAIAKSLEQRVLDKIDAFNARNFDPSSPIFYLKHPQWRVEMPAALSRNELTLSELLAAFQRFIAHCPRYHLRATSFNSTVDVSEGVADVFVDVEASGTWKGIVQRHVTLHYFKRFKGDWLHTAQCTINGVDLEMPNAA